MLELALLSPDEVAQRGGPSRAASELLQASRRLCDALEELLLNVWTWFLTLEVAQHIADATNEKVRDGSDHTHRTTAPCC